MNRLAKEQSPYLRHAASQPIDWHPWSDEPFERARTENKPVFLSSGGVWCHWCHVMAEESFSDPAVAALLNELFISIKLDRDERPEIDRRYQQAVAAMGGGSGWPLSVFLTPDRKPFFGGTYFPPDDRQGRPGFRRVLSAVSEYYATRREQALEVGNQVMESLRHEPAHPGELDPTLEGAAAADMLALFDITNGGFGGAPKFPQPGALEFLMARVVLAGDQAAGAAVRATLDGMDRGGIHDQLGGGFHRYSTDEAWIIPHFEKMADDNAWLLRNYVDAYAVFGDERYRQVAEDILRFTGTVLADRAGGFFASQDADTAPSDEGGYFTWTDDELKGALTAGEYEVASRLLLGSRGAMHHDPSRYTLYRTMEPGEIARVLGKDEASVRAAAAQAREKLLSAREKREQPFVDRTRYASLNGMMISAWFRAGRILGDEGARDFAGKSLDRVLRELVQGDAVRHRENVTGGIDDYVFLIDALVEGYQALGDRGYLDRAELLMDACIRRFGDRAGGFFDTESEVLGVRMKRGEDLPHPSANARAIMILLTLGAITDAPHYRERAEAALRIFAPQAAGMGVHAGSILCAVQAWSSLLTLTIEAAADSELARAAQGVAGRPVALRYGPNRGRVLPCSGGACFEPAASAAELRAILARGSR